MLNTILNFSEHRHFHIGLYQERKENKIKEYKSTNSAICVNKYEAKFLSVELNYTRYISFYIVTHTL